MYSAHLSSIGRGQKRAKISNRPVLGRFDEIRRSNGILCIELNSFEANDVSGNGFNGDDSGLSSFKGLDHLESWPLLVSPAKTLFRLAPAISISLCASHMTHLYGILVGFSLS